MVPTSTGIVVEQGGSLFCLVPVRRALKAHGDISM